MTREWKPGDVALVDSCGEGPKQAVWTNDCAARVGHPEGPHWHVHTGRWLHAGKRARPLVVVDPEDREQVDRLVVAMGYSIGTGSRVEQTQDALRSLIEPPKPDEPTGLGAVVEDNGGGQWIKIDTHKACNDWTVVGNSENPADGTRRWKYADIAAVRVLSEGVQP